MAFFNGLLAYRTGLLGAAVFLLAQSAVQGVRPNIVRVRLTSLPSVRRRRHYSRRLHLPMRAPPGRRYYAAETNYGVSRISAVVRRE